MVGSISDFLPEMTQTVIVRAPSTSRDLFGVQGSAPAASTFFAHVQIGAVSSRFTQGIDTAVSAIAWVASTGQDAITRASRVTLPDGSTPPVLRVTHSYDEKGIHHTVVVFG